MKYTFNLGNMNYKINSSNSNPNYSPNKEIPAPESRSNREHSYSIDSISVTAEFDASEFADFLKGVSELKRLGTESIPVIKEMIKELVPVIKDAVLEIGGLTSAHSLKQAEQEHVFKLEEDKIKEARRA